MKGVTSFRGRTVNRKGEKTMSWAVSVADPRIFSALQMYIPPSFLVTLWIFRVPSCAVIPSPARLPTNLDL